MQQAYLELKLAWELFKKGPDQLSEPEKSRLENVASKQSRIEQAILASPDAALVVVPAATLATRLSEIRQRYDNQEAYLQDLDNLGLNSKTLASVVERDLRIEATLEKVAAAVGEITQVDAEIYYRLHPKAFDRPATRRLRHILMTFDTPAEKLAALKTLEKLRSTVKTSEEFAQAALRHSQCPTAMEGGILGAIKRGQLYAELEPSAFALAEGELSAPTESPIGLHLLYCEEIYPDGPIAFDEVSQRIIERLTEQRQQQAQREWIQALLQSRNPSNNTA